VICGQGCGTLIRCCLRKRPKGRTDCGCSRTKGLKEGKKCEMIRLGNNGRHGPAEEALGVGGLWSFFFPQLVRVLVVETVLPSYREHDALKCSRACDIIIAAVSLGCLL